MKFTRDLQSDRVSHCAQSGVNCIFAARVSLEAVGTIWGKATKRATTRKQTKAAGRENKLKENAAA